MIVKDKGFLLVEVIIIKIRIFKFEAKLKELLNITKKYIRYDKIIL